MRKQIMRAVGSTLLATISISAFGQRSVNRSIFANLEKYSPNGYEVVSQLAQLPKEYDINGIQISLNTSEDPSFWVDGKSQQDVLNSLGTVVHESVHGLTNRLAYQMLAEHPTADYKFADDFSAFFLDKDEVYLVRHTQVFSSNDLKNTIPEALQTFRYSPYIAPKRNLGSQVHGIYGLMDEWNAYCQGTRTSLDILKGFLEDGGTHDPSIYLDLVSNGASSRFAYFEFKYYILKYLELARKRHSRVFREIIDNQELRRAYTAIDQRFGALNIDFDRQLQSIANTYADDPEVKVRQDGSYFFINGSGVGLFLEDFAPLQEVLTRPDMVALHQQLMVE